MRYRTDPVLQDQPWSSFVDELLRQDGIREDDFDEPSDSGNESTLLFSAQNSIEQWVADNVPPPTNSATPTPPADADKELVCYGMVSILAQYVSKLLTSDADS